MFTFGTARHRYRESAWPATIGEGDFRRRCLKVIRRAGWTIEQYVAGTTCCARKDGIKLFVVFLSPSEETLFSKPKDVSELIATVGSANILIVTFNPDPNREIREIVENKSLGMSSFICVYHELSKALAEISEMTVAGASERGDEGTAAEGWADAVALIRRREWPEALRVLASLDFSGPVATEGRAYWILALRESGRLEEADVLASEFIAVVPHYPRVWIERALISFVRRDWLTARKQFAEIRAQFPDQPDGYLRGAQAAREMLDRDDAEKILADAITKFPKLESVFSYFASYALELGDWIVASERWASYRAAFPESPTGFVAGARALIGAGKHQLAASLLRQAVEQFPSDREVLVQYARHSSERLGARDAYAAWSRASQVYPDDREIADAMAKAALHSGCNSISLEQEPALLPAPNEDVPMLGRDEIVDRSWLLRWAGGATIARGLRLLADGSVNPLPSVNEVYWDIVDRCLCILSQDRYCTLRFNQVDRRDDGTYKLVGRYTLAQDRFLHVELDEDCTPFAEVISKFDSLGDNCEFGIVQRYYGIEPLGLFRFNFTYMDPLLAGLDEAFDHLNQDDCFNLEVVDNTYVGNVNKYRFRYHIPHTVDEMSPDKVTLNEQRKLKFLRRKFLEDLQEADKIFVRKGEGAGSLQEIMPLYNRLRAYGNNKLLWVTLADEKHAEGTVERVGDGLLHGYVKRFSEYNAATFISGNTWAKVCRNAYRIVFGQ